MADIYGPHLYTLKDLTEDMRWLSPYTAIYEKAEEFIHRCKIELTTERNVPCPELYRDLRTQLNQLGREIPNIAQRNREKLPDDWKPKPHKTY